MRLILFIAGILFSIGGFAQESPKEEYQKVLDKISNKKATFFVTNPVRLTDSTGKVVGMRNLVELEDSYMKKVARQYGERLVPYLITLLDDPKKDWAANLLLYAITKSSAVTLKYYNTNNIEDWRQLQKQSDKDKWKKYLQESK